MTEDNADAWRGEEREGGERCVLAAAAAPSPLSVGLAMIMTIIMIHHYWTATCGRGHNAPLIKHVTIYNYTSPLQLRGEEERGGVLTNPVLLLFASS